jgi:hypothetical protein
VSNVYPSPRPKTSPDREPSGWPRLSRGRLFLTVRTDEVLHLPLPNPLGLVVGDILAVRHVSLFSLRLDNLRDLYSDRERAMPVRQGCLVERLLSHPLTSVTAEGAIPIEGYLFPVREGEHYVLVSLDCGSQRPLYLMRGENV